MTPLRAWDAEGHEIVAAIAFAHLNPQAQKAVAEFAREMPNPNRAYDNVTLACWMDDIKKDPAMPDHGRFLSWHYIDIGIAPGDSPVDFEPGTDTDVRGNVVQALKRAVAVLKGGTDPYIRSKAMACAMVMHLVGDIHQPLHCATKYFFSHDHLLQDFGGNKEDVLNGPAGDLKFNLHAFWDSAYRASFDSVTGSIALDAQFNQPQNIQTLAAAIDRQPAPAGDLQPTIDQWARESNDLAKTFAYREITVTENKKYCRLSSAYVAKANALSRERLHLAALRLATLLNETLGAH